jgi:hypothetical protein
MATTTPNFGWAVPTSSDLVKNGATAIETLGDAIDASMMDLKGGTTDQVLAKNSSTDMDFKWVTAAAGGGSIDWVAVNSGGTSLSGSTTTISGISGANHLLVTWLDASGNSTSGDFEVNINGDTGTNYFYGGTYAAGGTTDWNGSGASGTTRIRIGNLPQTNSGGYGYCLITGGTTTGVKSFQSSMGSNQSGNFSSSVGGWWNNTATISSISVKVTTGSFDAGKVYVFKSA